MKQSVDDKAAMLGEYIVQNKATVRRAAKQFGVSKSTVHKDVAERLRHVNLEAVQRGARRAGGQQGAAAYPRRHGDEAQARA